MKSVLLLVLVVLFFKASSQDFIRIGVAHDFGKEKVLQTFSFDFNRTEKVDEKKGRFILYNRKGYYLTPTSNVNIGDGVSASENNILFQFYAGKSLFGKLHKSKNNLVTSAWNKAIEINPTLISDKNFDEKLAYAQFKLIANFISSESKDATSDTYIKSAFSLSPGIFANLGYRHSDTYNSGHSYSTIGFLLDLKYRLLKKVDDNIYDNWIFALSGNYYYIAAEVRELVSDNYAGFLTASIDKQLFKSLYLGLLYKYNTDNPTYSIVHTIEFSLKVSY